MDINLIDRMKELREEFDMSQRELSKRADVSQSVVSHIESGRNEATGSTLKAIANVFGVSVDYLLGISDERHLPYLEEKPSMSFDEKKLLEFYRLLSPKNKENIFYVLEMGTRTSRTLPMEAIKESIYAN